MTSLTPSDPQASIVSASPQAYSTDEIDLIGLVESIWGEKLLIALVTAASILLGGAYAFLAEETWTAHAVATSPTASQRLELDSLLKRMALAEIGGLDKAAAPYPQFLALYNATDNKLAFIRGYEPTSSILADQESEIGKRAWANALAETILAKKPKDEDYFRLQLSSAQPTTAAQWLSAYIEYTSGKVVEETQGELSSLIKLAISDTRSQLDYVKAKTTKSLVYDIEQTSFAYEIAEAASIDKPFEAFEERYTTDRFPIHLGTKALEKKSEILKNIKDPGQINNAIGELETRLDLLKSLTADDLNFYPARLLQSPEPPTKRDKPKRALILVLAAAAGGMLGCLVALVRIQVRARRGTPAAIA